MNVLIVVGSKHAPMLNAQSLKDWRLATNVELDVLFNNPAGIGGFERSGAYPKAWYVQRFGDGRQIGQKRSVVRSWEA